MSFDFRRPWPNRLGQPGFPGKWQFRLTACAITLIFSAAFCWPHTLVATQTGTAGLGAGQALAVEQISQQITAIEWLAPLAPVALSPFFGLALLSGIACFGPEWLPQNALLSDQSPLANPALFWVFITLTAMTSAPRFSKVSKPFAQFADFLETWSSLIVLMAMKWLTASAPDSAETVVMVQAGIFQWSIDTVIAIAMAINVIVINGVKFFFEFLVWITPVPLLDSIFELTNKSVCGGLMAIYVYSPVLALTINIILFLLCLVIFRWARRREVFFRTVVTDYVLSWFVKRRGNDPPEQLVVFPDYDIGEIKRRSRCWLTKSSDGLQLRCPRLLRTPLVIELDSPTVVEQGWWTNCMRFPDGSKVSFSVRYNNSIEQLAQNFDGRVQFSNKPADNAANAKQIEFG